MSGLPVIDVVFIVIILLMLVRGYLRGFVEEIFSWVSKIVAVGVAVLLFRKGAEFIRTFVMENVPYIPEMISLIVIFVIVIIISKVLQRFVTDVMTAAKLKGMDKILGLVFGLVEGLAITGIVCFLLAAQPIFDASAILSDSIFAELLLPVIKIPFNWKKDELQTVLLMMGFRITA